MDSKQTEARQAERFAAWRLVRSRDDIANLLARVHAKRKDQRFEAVPVRITGFGVLGGAQ